MKRLLALILAAALCLTLTACGQGSGESESESTSSETSSESSLPEVERPVSANVENRSEDIKAAYEKNSDVVGWLYIPGLDQIDSPVVQDTEGYSYEKRDAQGNYDFVSYWVTGAYFAHMKNTFGDSTQLSRNTIIFGHSDLGITNKNKKEDDPEGPLFSQLYSFTDEEFAKKTPYIYFSTGDEDMVFEVFSVMYNDSGLWYIQPRPDTKDYGKFLETARDRSIYDYGVEVNTDDKIITLSTCTVKYGWNVRSDYRFVIMGKLIDSEDATKKEADFTVNPDPAEPKGAPYEVK